MTTRRKPRILLVDDDLNLLNMLEMGLRADYDVVSVFDPKRALEVFEQGNFDVVITDVIMPKLSGFEVLRRVKETSELVEVILLTGELPDKARPAITALQNGAHDYLTKPVSLLELKATVQRALQKTTAADGKQAAPPSTHSEGSYRLPDRFEHSKLFLLSAESGFRAQPAPRP